MPINDTVSRDYSGRTAADDYRQGVSERTPSVNRDNSEKVQEAPLPTSSGNPERVAQVRTAEDRIAALEALVQQQQSEISANKPKAPHGFLANGDPVPNATHPYENPRDYNGTLVLSTGELVGAPNPQSTSHWSRVLHQDVPVVRYIQNGTWNSETNKYEREDSK